MNNFNAIRVKKKALKIIFEHKHTTKKIFCSFQTKVLSISQSTKYTPNENKHKLVNIMYISWL